MHRSLPCRSSDPAPRRGRARPGRAYLREVMDRSEGERNFRIFCPDELESNKLGAVLEVTGRAHTWSNEADSRFTPDGRVVEVLAEHLCEGFLEVPQDRPPRAVPVLRGVHPDRRLADRAVRQVAQGVERDAVAPAARVAQHPAHVGRVAAGPQRLLAPEPGLHQQPAHQEGHRPADHPPARRQHADETVARCLRSTGYINLVIATEAAPAAVAVDGRGQGACRRGRIDLALGVDRRGHRPRRGIGRGRDDPTNETLAAVDLLRRTCRTCGSAWST